MKTSCPPSSFRCSSTANGGDTWGSTTAERSGSGRPNEIEVLHTAAEVLGAAIERGALDDRLRESGERHLDLIEQVPAILYTDLPLEGETTYVSPQIEAILGVTARDWMEDPDDLWIKMLHPDDRDRALAQLESFLAGSGEDLDDYRLVRPDGRVVWIRDRGRVERDSESRVVVEHGVLLDVTEVKEAEARVLEAEERFRVLVEGGTSIIYMDDPGENGDTIYISPQIEDLLGCTQEEFLVAQDLWVNALHPDDRERIMALEDSSHSAGTPYEAEYRIFNSRGETSWLHEQARLVVDEDGLPLYWLGVMLDITEQKQAQEEAREAEERFRLLVESSVAVTYIDGAEEPRMPLYVSPQVENLFGYTREEWLQDSKLWLDMLHPDDHERLAALDERTDETGEPFSAEFRVINSRAEELWIHDESNLVRRPDGSPLYWLGIMVDITEAKRAETLEHELALEQATSARLRDLDQAKDALLTAVSHDFRAPLANILGFAATLEESGSKLSPDDVKGFIHRIAANGWRLERLVADIMEVSRFREGVADIERMTTDLAGLVERVVEQASLGKKYPVTVAAEPIVMSFDLPKVERLVQNLITNAVVHNPDGVAVRVRVGPVPGGAQISVEDNGKGVPEDVIAGLFEEFTVDEETMHRGAAPGLGLGLSIVKRFAELHGGRVWHEEPERGGAAFHVFLPGETAEVESAR